MSTGAYIALGFLALLWFGGIWFLSGPLIRHILWKRWQRKHRHSEPLSHLGKPRL